ncbi:hypothetical protein ACIFOT_23940 [Neobacillus sp. NRS-1170]|uniref:hypothetical protein n=1 Tax=Neobacillus sp. NRS-1170 TaxID=3233898 RepID=UPI003D2C9C87
MLTRASIEPSWEKGTGGETISSGISKSFRVTLATGARQPQPTSPSPVALKNGIVFGRPKSNITE